MLHVDGYTVDKCVRATDRSRVYFGTRDQDHLPVVLKRYESDRKRRKRRTRSRAARELEILRRVEHPSIVRGVELVTSVECPVLVLERLAGSQLGSVIRAELPSLEAFLTLALRLCDAVAAVHAERVIHRDIKPSNILVGCGTSGPTVHLIDFGLARQLGAAGGAGELRSATQVFGGTLDFMAPEQSGRMARGIDLHSDLYSVGAVLYYMLTGQRPFVAKDALELLHAHVARVPDSPREHRADVPHELCELVLKLLKKEPDERYQSAQALRVDLALCLESFRAHGRIVGVTLGSADVPDRPLFGDDVHGREDEVRVLRDAYARAVSEGGGIALVGGPPGVGKSALCRALRPDVLARRGYFVQGKFDLYRRDVPYSGFVAVLQSLVDQWLAESPERLRMRQAALRGALGGIAAVMVDLVPDLAFMIGDVPGVPILGSREARARLGLAARRFLSACASSEHPLVVHLDDLHWADDGSCSLLAQLFEEPLPGLMIVATHRVDADAVAPFASAVAQIEARGMPVTRLDLQPLSLEGVADMLADALRCSVESVVPLARCVARKTGTSPLLVRHMVEWMYQERMLRYRHPAGWSWDLAQVDAAATPDDAVALLGARMERLQPSEREVVVFASVSGDTFSPESLAETWDGDEAALDAALYRLYDEGLIAPCREGLRFVHDRVREAAQGLLSASEREHVHHRAAKRLLARLSESELLERALAVSDHLNRAQQLLSREERIRAMQLNLVAGKQCLATGSATASHGYLTAARAILEDVDWADHPDLAFEILDRSVVCALQIGAFDLASALIDDLERRARSVSELGAVLAHRVELYRLTKTAHETVDLVLSLLRRIGVRWQEQPSILRVYWDIVRTDWALRDVRAGRRGAPPRGDGSERERAVMALLAAAAGTIAVVSRRLALVTMSWRLRGSLRRGYLRSPGTELIVYGVYSFYFRKSAERMRQYGAIGLQWCAGLEDAPGYLRARYALAALVHPWIMPRRQALSALPALADDARELGELEFAMYCRILFAQLRGDTGVRLDLAQQEALSLGTLAGTTVARVLQLLVEGGDDPANLDAEMHRFHALPLWVRDALARLWMMVLCVLDHPERALAVLESLSEHGRDQMYGGMSAADSSLIHALCVRASLEAPSRRAAEPAWSDVGAESSGGPSVPGRTEPGVRAARTGHGSWRRRPNARRAAAKTLAKLHRRMRAWARGGPDFVHMERLIQAERDRLDGKLARASTTYAQAATRAATQAYVHHAAIATERQALVLIELRRHREAHDKLRAAVRLYKQWGAHAKVALLERRP
jgi:hypothetical protein